MKDINFDNINLFEIFTKKYNQEMKGMNHANLVIAGKTGVGKSTLINAAFREDIAQTGMGRPVTDEMRVYEKKNFPLRIYDTMGLELDEERREKSLEEIRCTCQEGKLSNDPDKMLHAMWYCVDSNSDRFEQFEADYINSISKDLDVILVLTKSFRRKHTDNMIREIEKEYPGLQVKSIQKVLAQDEDIEECDENEKPKKAFGVKNLVEATAQIIPESAQKAWCNAQKASMELKVKRAHVLVMSSAAVSFGEGYIPLPFSDAFALVPTEIAMFAGINAIFGISVSDYLLQSIVTSLVGTAGATFAGRTIVSNLLKMIPGVGTVVGGTISGTTASALTIALGEAYITIMKMISEGEIDEHALETKEVQDKMQGIFKENLKKK